MKSVPSPFGLLARSVALRRAASQYWIIDPLIGALKNGIFLVLRAMPVDSGSALGRRLGLLSAAVFKPSEARARRLWKRLHPDLADEESTDSFIKRLWGNVGRTMAEFSLLERIWDQGRIEVVGLEHLTGELRAGRPVIIAGIHLGNWELMSVVFKKNGLQPSSLALVLDNRFEQRLAVRTRNKIGGRVVHATRSNVNDAIAEIVGGKAFAIFIDDFSRGRVHAPAFGRILQPTGNIAYLPRVARITGASVIVGYCARLGDGARFRLTMLAPLKLEFGSNPRADAVRNATILNDIIEPIIKDHLDQWYYALDIDLDN